MVIDKGKVTDTFLFSFKGEILPSIHKNPARFLGRIERNLCFCLRKGRSEFQRHRSSFKSFLIVDMKKC